MLDWAEKYRPKSLKAVAGNPSAISQLRSWARSWEEDRPKKRGVILVGEPGVGKTSATHALARDFGWGVIEMNASDKRNADAVRRIATRGALYETFTDEGDFIHHREGGRKLIILDEADNLFGREDLGGIGAIVDTIRKTQQPIALIVNDYYQLTRRSSAIKGLCLAVRFQRPRAPTIAKVLRDIARSEGVEVDEQVISYLSESCNGDIRSAINDLQALSQGKDRVTEDDLLALGYRDERKEVFQALYEIFRSGDLEAARRSVMALDEDPERLILWIDENLPYEYRDPEDLERALQALARADQYLGLTRMSQQYGLWRYASDLMSGGLAVARQGSYAGAQYRFPLWLAKMSRTRHLRATAASLLQKLGRHCHVSKRSAREFLLPAFRYLFKQDEDFRMAQSLQLELDAREIAFLLGEKEDSKAVKRVLQGVESMRSRKGTLSPFSRFES
jgi:replication factor C large subunit